MLIDDSYNNRTSIQSSSPKLRDEKFCAASRRRRFVQVSLVHLLFYSTFIIWTVEQHLSPALMVMDVLQDQQSKKRRAHIDRSKTQTRADKSWTARQHHQTYKVHVRIYFYIVWNTHPTKKKKKQKKKQTNPTLGRRMDILFLCVCVFVYMKVTHISANE